MITGEEAIRQIASETDTILLAFSCGKDAIGAWLACRPHFRRIIPYYMYLVPGLQFVEDALAYYEEFFQTRILRVPHPSLYRLLNAFVFQPPERCALIEAAGLEEFSYRDMQDTIRDRFGLPDAAMVASGVRAVDSPMRMLALRKYGPINRKKAQFMPVCDWNLDRLVSEIERANVRLPIDYRIFGRSFDGIDYRFLAPLKEHLPADYERVLQWFPLADLELKRRQYAEAAA